HLWRNRVSGCAPGRKKICCRLATTLANPLFHTAYFVTWRTTCAHGFKQGPHVAGRVDPTAEVGMAPLGEIGSNYDKRRRAAGIEPARLAVCTATATFQEFSQRSPTTRRDAGSETKSPADAGLFFAATSSRLFLFPGSIAVLDVPAGGSLAAPALRKGLADVSLPLRVTVGVRDFPVKI